MSSYFSWASKLIRLQRNRLNIIWQKKSMCFNVNETTCGLYTADWSGWHFSVRNWNWAECVYDDSSSQNSASCFKTSVWCEGQYCGQMNLKLNVWKCIAHIYKLLSGAYSIRGTYRNILIIEDLSGKNTCSFGRLRISTQITHFSVEKKISSNRITYSQKQFLRIVTFQVYIWGAGGFFLVEKTCLFVIFLNYMRTQKQFSFYRPYPSHKYLASFDRLQSMKLRWGGRNERSSLNSHQFS